MEYLATIEQGYDNSFAIMTLNGPNANVDYYTVPSVAMQSGST